MIQIYHNPRCSKSREGLAAVETTNQPVEIIKYMENPLTKVAINDLLNKLNYKPIELIRTKEKIWIEQYKGKNLSDKKIIEAMASHPNLIERPILVYGNKAVVARPTAKIKEIL